MSKLKDTLDEPYRLYIYIKTKPYKYKLKIL